MTPDQRKVLEESHKLLTVSIDALAKAMHIQTDQNVVALLQQSMFRLFESRYWLSEVLTLPSVPDAKPEKPKVTKN